LFCNKRIDTDPSAPSHTQQTQFTAIPAPKQVDQAPRSSEAVLISGKRPDAGGDFGELGPGFGSGVVDVQVTEIGCAERGTSGNGGACWKRSMIGKRPLACVRGCGVRGNVTHQSAETFLP
jgi:hypothetical protein